MSPGWLRTRLSMVEIDFHQIGLIRTWEGEGNLPFFVPIITVDYVSRQAVPPFIARRFPVTDEKLRR